MKRLFLCTLAASCVVFSSASAFSQLPFKAVKVPGASPNTPIAINNKGEVMVNTATSTAYSVSIWNRLSGSRAVPIVGTNQGAEAMNNSSDIVGAESPNSSGTTDAYLWQGSTRNLPSLGGTFSVAYGLNDAAAVAGTSYTATGAAHAFLWTQSGGIRDLTPNLTSVSGATATGVNSSSQVSGYYFPNGSNRTLGFYWTQAGGLIDIGTPGTVAYAISTAGTVVGKSPNSAGYQRAFSWTSSGGLRTMGTLGGSQSAALSINNLGWIIGTSLDNSGSGLPHGFLQRPSASMTDFTKIANFTTNQVPYSMQVNDFGVIAVSTNTGGYVLVPNMTSTFTSSANPSIAGQPVTFTSTLNSIAGPPPDGETVQFLVSGAVVATVPMKGGVARYTTSSIAQGSHAVVAKYGGDANYLPAKYTAITQVVNP